MVGWDWSIGGLVWPKMLASHWSRSFCLISQEILSFFTWVKKVTPPIFLWSMQWWAVIGPVEVGFGQNAGFSLVKRFLLYISGNIEFFDIGKNIPPLFFTAYTKVGWDWEIEGLVWPK